MELASDLGTSLSGALAVAPTKSPSGERRLIVPLTANNKLAILDAESGKALGHAETGIAPFGSVISRRRNDRLCDQLGWTTAEATRPDVAKSGPDKVVIDKSGIASTGTVTRIDLNTRKATHTIQVELHPTAILWDESRATLYVANGNKDSVSVIDTRSQRVARTIAIQPFSQNVAGIAPTALAISPEGTKLYVACGGINAIAVVDTASAKIDGLIPTAWYPNSLAMSPDGKRMAVSSLLGPGSGWRESPGKRFVHAYRGAVSVIELPDASQLAGYSTAVAENSHLSLRSAATD